MRGGGRWNGPFMSKASRHGIWTESTGTSAKIQLRIRPFGCRHHFFDFRRRRGVNRKIHPMNSRPNDNSFCCLLISTCWFQLETTDKIIKQSMFIKYEDWKKHWIEKVDERKSEVSGKEKKKKSCIQKRNTQTEITW